MSLPQKDGLAHTYGDYLQWPDEVRYELIDGQAYLMAPPAPSLSHQDVAGEIYHQIRQLLDEGPCRAYIAPVDVLLPERDEKDEQVDTVVQPDVLVVRDPQKRNDRRVRGAPDWVVEVLSPATASHDQIHKRRIYERAGVAEFWLVHPNDRLLTIYRLNNGEYGKPEIRELKGSTPIGPLAGVEITWDALVERLPNPG